MTLRPFTSCVPLVFATLLWHAESHADCSDAPTDQLRSHVATVELAFEQLDEPLFDEGAAALRATIPCVREPLGEDESFAIHRAMALILFVDADMPATRKAWGAVRRIRPEWEPSARAAPPGHILRGLFDAATDPPDPIGLGLAPEGGWRVDGRETDQVPRPHTFVLQALERDGNVSYTGYHLSVADIPIERLAKPTLSPRKRRARAVGTAVAGGLLAGAGVGLGVHIDTRARLAQAGYGEIDALARRANVSGVAAAVLGGASATAFTVAWAIPW